MRFGLATWGSTGDIRPFLALAGGLVAAGHDVQLVIADVFAGDYRAPATAGGFSVTQLDIARDAEFMDGLGKRALAARNALMQLRLIYREMLRPALPAVAAAARALARDCDVIVRHAVLHGAQAASLAAGRRDVSLVLAHNLLPTRHIRPAQFPALGSPGTALAWWLGRKIVNHWLLDDINRERRAFGQNAVRDVIDATWFGRDGTLVAVSPSILARPPDWPAPVEISGFLDLPPARDSDLPDPVANFLTAGDSPLFMSYGSMLPRTVAERQRALRVFADAARASARRAIIQCLAGDIAHLPRHASLHYVTHVDHRLLMPHCALVVHHGGAGTTHTTLKSGVPCIVVPHIADQFFWAAEARRLGVATTVIAVSRLTATRLARAIADAQARRDCARRARELGAALANEDGVARAVAWLLEKFV